MEGRDLQQQLQDLHDRGRKNEWRLDALDRHRDRVDAELARLRERLDGLVSAKEIAEAVTEALKREHEEEDKDKVTIGNLKLARWQVWLGVAALVATIASPYIQTGLH